MKLWTAIVVERDESGCRVYARGAEHAVAFSKPFAPRAESVQPGHLVALAPRERGADLVVWRWFDALVLRRDAEQVELWEPAHGVVRAIPRDPRMHYRPGSRAYLSAGMPGADWWLCGPADGEPDAAQVDADEVIAFYASHGLWDELT